MTPVSNSRAPTPAPASSALSPISSKESLNQKVQLGAAQRSLNANGSLTYKLDIAGISKENLAKAISTAVQSGKVDLNASPAVINARTASQVGSDVLAIAKGLDIKTDKKSVKQLIAEISDKTVGSKTGKLMLPTKLLNGLGALSLAAVASEGEGKLNALGIKAEYEYKGGTLGIKLVGGEKTGLKAEFSGKLTGKVGNADASVEVRANTQGGTAAKGTLKIGKSGNSSAAIEVSGSSIRGGGEPQFKAKVEGETKIGTIPVEASITATDKGKGIEVGVGAGATFGRVKVSGEVTPTNQEIKATVSF